MLGFFSNELFLGAAGMASIIGLAWLLVQVFSNNRKRLYYQRTTEVLVKASPSSAIHQEILVDGKASSKLNLDTFVLLNKSKKAITEKDFLTLPSWDISTGTLLYSLIHLEGSNGATASWEFLEDRIKITGLKMPRDGAVSIAAFHNGNVSNSVSAAPMEIEDLQKKTLTSRKSIWTVKSTLASLQGSMAVFGLVYMFGGIFLASTRTEPVVVSMRQYTSIGLGAFASILTLALVFQLGKHFLGTNLNPSNASLEESNITETALRALESKASK